MAACVVEPIIAGATSCFTIEGDENAADGRNQNRPGAGNDFFSVWLACSRVYVGDGMASETA